MKRIIGYALAVLLLYGAASASAQTAVWTGDYYVVIGMAEKLGYAAAYGQHLKWNDIKAGPNFEGGTFADLAVAPTRPHPYVRTAGRYDLLAVGAKDGQAYTAAGYEWDRAPYFAGGIQPIADLTEATAVAWSGTYYVVLGRAMGGDGVLPTPHDALAYGRPGDWSVTVLPFNDELTFTHLAIGTRGDPTSLLPTYEMLAVGMYQDGSAFAMTAAEINGAPVLSGNPLPIPDLVRPTSVEWIGDGFIVAGQNSAGDVAVVYGTPGAWSRAKDFHLDGGVFTSLAVAPHERGYDLLAVGGLKGMAVSLPGTEIGGTPAFEHGCNPIDGLLALVSDYALPAPGNEDANLVGAPYPNPFNPQARFTVTLAADQAVRAEVFNLLGRRVAVLHDGLLTGGIAHTFAVDGATLPSGTYVLRVQGEDFVRTHALQLVK